MTHFELRDYPDDFFGNLDYGIVELAEWSEGDVVDVEDGGLGVVTSLMTETFDFPVGPEDEENEGLRTIEASEDAPVYVVATEDGLRAVDDEAIKGEGEFPEGPGGKEAAKDLAQNGEEAAVYGYVEDSHSSYAELQRAKKRYIADNYAEELSDAGITEPLDASYEELINIPGDVVEDPGVGWSDYPPSWEKAEKPARLILLDAWTSLGGTFTTCRADMVGDISRPSRFCASMKDEVLQTERWRNRF